MNKPKTDLKTYEDEVLEDKVIIEEIQTKIKRLTESHAYVLNLVICLQAKKQQIDTVFSEFINFIKNRGRKLHFGANN